MPNLIHPIPEDGTSRAFYNAGVTAVITLGDQAMADNVSPPHLAALLAGMFAGALSGLQGLATEQQIRELFEGCLAASDDGPTTPQGVH